MEINNDKEEYLKVIDRISNPVKNILLFDVRSYISNTDNKYLYNESTAPELVYNSNTDATSTLQKVVIQY